MIELIRLLYLVTKSKRSGKKDMLLMFENDLHLFMANFIIRSEMSIPTTDDPP